MNQHLDPERLAAFMDGSLPRAERAAVEAHAADCAQCLQLLAAMARTEPVAARGGWRLPALVPWTVPLAAAATAFALWVNVTSRRSEQTASTPAATEAVRQAESAPSQPPPDEKIAGQRRRDIPSKPVARQDAVVPPQSAAPSAAPVPQSAGARAPRTDSDTVAAYAKSAPSLSAQMRSEQPSRPAQEVPTPLEERVGVVGPDREASAAQRQDQLFRLAGAAAPVSVQVVSPDPLLRWRARGTLVERSIDGGKTWVTPAAILHAAFLAGSSPAPNVAWLVGRSGAVFRTVGGQEWQRLDFPAIVDLTAVRARSDLEADVTAADGRVFRTADGGRTWSVQETPRPAF